MKTTLFLLLPLCTSLLPQNLSVLASADITVSEEYVAECLAAKRENAKWKRLQQHHVEESKPTKEMNLSKKSSTSVTTILEIDVVPTVLTSTKTYTLLFGNKPVPSEVTRLLTTDVTRTRTVTSLKTLSFMLPEGLDENKRPRELLAESVSLEGSQEPELQSSTEY